MMTLPKGDIFSIEGPYLNDTNNTPETKEIQLWKMKIFQAALSVEQPLGSYQGLIPETDTIQMFSLNYFKLNQVIVSKSH